MSRSPRTFRPFCLLWAAVLSFCAGLTTARGEAVVTDIVFLMDVSASMRELQVGDGQTITFDQLSQRLQGFVDSGLPANSNVTIITFGQDAQQHEQIQVKDAEGRKRLREALGKLKAEARYTYMTKGIALGLAELDRLKREFPSHYRLAFLITDGKNNPPVPPDQAVTFSQLRAQVRDQLDLRPGDDFYLWYAHFGDADAEVQELTRQWLGESKPFAGDWSIGRFNFDRRVIRLAEQLPGDWTAQFPLPEDLEREEYLIVESYNAAGKELRLGPVVIPNLPADAQIRVEPQVVKLTDQPQQVVLKFHGANVPPGTYSGRLPLGVPAGFIIPSPQFFYLDLKVAQPVVSVAPAEKVDLGAVTPAAGGKANLVFTPNAAAVALDPSVQLALQWAGGVKGIALEATPPTFKLSERKQVQLSASLLDKPPAEPGPVAGKLLLKTDNPYVKLEPSEVALELQVQPLKISLERSEFLVEPEEDGSFELPLGVDAQALTAQTEVPFSLGPVKPVTTEKGEAGPALDLSLPTNRLSRQRPAVNVGGRIAKEKPGKWAYEVPILTESPLVVFVPNTVRLVLTIASPEIDVTPTGTIDFGLLQPGGEASREIFLSPNEAAKSRGATIAVRNLETPPEGVSLKMEPETVPLREKATIRLTLQVQAGADQAKTLEGTIALETSDKSVALNVQELKWKAEVATAFVDVIPGETLDFGTLEAGGQQTRSLWLAPNETAASLAPTVTVKAEDLPEGTSISIEPEEVKLDEKREIRVTLTGGLSEGKQTIRLVLGCDQDYVRLSARQLAVTYTSESPGATFDAKKLRFDGLAPGDSKAVLPLRVTASPGALGKTVRLDWEFERLPEGMAVVPELEQITLAQRTEQVSVSLSLRGAVAGNYSGRVRARADFPVTPQELPVEIAVEARVVEVVGAKETWTLKGSLLSGRATAELPLTLRASRPAEGTTVTAAFSGAEVQGIRVTTEPSELKLSAGDNPLEVRAELRLSPGFLKQTYQGELKFTADSPETVIRPDAVNIEVIVPGLWPYVAFAAVLLLAVGYWFWPARITDQLVSLVLEEKPASVAVLFRNAEKAEGDRLPIGSLRKYRVRIGSHDPQRTAGRTRPPAPDVAIRGDANVRPEHARISRRGSQYWIRALFSLSVIGDRHRSVSGGRKEPLYDGDKLQIGQVIFVFRRPGSSRRPKAARRRR